MRLEKRAGDMHFQTQSLDFTDETGKSPWMFQGLRVMCIKKIIMAGLLISMALESLRIDASLAVGSPRGQKCSISDSTADSLFCCVCLQFVPSGRFQSLSPAAVHVVDSNC